VSTVNHVPRYTITLATKPGMLSSWIDEQRKAGYLFVVVRGHSARAIVVAYRAFDRSGIVTVLDPDGATKEFHPIIGKTDRGGATRSKHVAFELHLLLGPAEPLGPAVGFTPMGKACMFHYGLSRPDAA
jgi:hypothetical protein